MQINAFQSSFQQLTASMKDSVNSPSTKKKNAGGAPKRNRNAVKHAVYSLDALRKGGRLDGRTSLSRVISARIEEYRRSWAGEVQPEDEPLIAGLVWDELHLARINAQLADLKHYGRKGKPNPLLELYDRYRNRYDAQRALLKIKRDVKPPDLAEQWRQRRTGESK